MRIKFQPSGVRGDVPAGQTLLEAATALGVEIESVCGGRGTCGKCRVIASGELSGLTDMERRQLSEAERAAGYRLACQASILGDVSVVVPEESRISRVSILSAGVERRVDLEPWVSRRVVSIPKPTLAEPSADLVRLEAVWAKQWPEPLKPTLRALQQLPLAVRAAEGLVTLLCADDEVVRIEPGQGPPRLLGLALDIGTTTVVGYLLDLETGRQLAVSSLLNPQTRYGDDVVSRIEFSQHEGGLATLQREIVAAINHIIEETVALATAAGEGGISADAILAMTVVGNTTMQHLFLGISPAALAQSPYVPAMTAAQCLRAHELGINIYPDAHVWTLPNIAGWVGADTVGVLLATGIYQDQEIGLAIDIGTNGEMALGSQERLITCSTAAGPAFEGAHLSCGMRAADGAIDAVHMNEDVHWHSIGGAPPRGICGSGLVDLVAEMLRVGVINTAGFMGDGEALRNNGQAKLADRLRQIGRQRAFELVSESQGAGGRPVLVTQRDVRELQLAKGAIRAGIEILIKELGIGREDVRRVYLAGAFGNYIRPQSALAIGLIPHFPNAEIIPVGNAAGSGAKMALLSRSCREQAMALIHSVEYLELSARADFQQEFAEAMLF